ncbi:MAG: trypsin-like peptidase domain-containing protein [Planctomycetota bacterium]
MNWNTPDAPPPNYGPRTQTPGGMDSRGNPAGAPRTRPLLVLVGLLSVALVLVASWRWSRDEVTDAAARSVTPRGEFLPDEQAQIRLFREASPSTVHVTAYGVKRNFYRVVRTEGTGTGFVWDKEGHIVTNFHVLNLGARLRRGVKIAKVTLSDQSSWDAALVGVSPNKDLAVLKIDAPADRLRPVPVGTSYDLQVGQKVLAIGNPFGLDQTLTTGVISALGREIESEARTTLYGVIQTDAAINPGNSGGPLLDSAGRLIGVNTAIASPTRAYAGIGFAIPADTVRHIVPDLIEHGQVKTPGLGVVLTPVSLRRNVYGLYIRDLLAGGSAEASGLLDQDGDRQGDIIVKINGRACPTINELQSILQDFSVGDTVAVSVIRDREIVEVPVKLQTLPRNEG